MKDVSRKTYKDRSGLFLGTILAALVVMVFALTLATAHSFAGRLPVGVNQAPDSWRHSTLYQPASCVVYRSSRKAFHWCGTKRSAPH
jgi:hypothetical protein